ncbi:MAG: ABC transporter permease [Anaerolineae bacterium]|jgi:peptide/nickel transport system permease protein
MVDQVNNGNGVATSAPQGLTDEERLYVASQWSLMFRHFKRHKLALIGAVIVILMYIIAIFHGFLAPYDKLTRSEYMYMAPQTLQFNDGTKFSLKPYVFGITATSDPKTFTRSFVIDESIRYPVKFFTQGDEYSFLGLFKSTTHLFGVDAPGHIYLLGTDDLGRDLFSRILYGSAISLSIGLVGVFTSFILGIMLGGISGYYGGVVDTVIQRVIEFLISIPTIPLWMALSAAVPASWTAIQVYFAISIILSLRGWCGLARIVRGKMLEVSQYDFVMAAKLAGARDSRIIATHLIPSFMSFLIVDMTLSIPSMILGETSLSFLGLGLRPPVVSWGVLLQAATNIRTVATYPWIMWPGAFLIITVMAFNFMGDGLRDAADPYKI